jgi:hypothetical protein
MAKGRGPEGLALLLCLLRECDYQFSLPWQLVVQVRVEAL